MITYSIVQYYAHTRYGEENLVIKFNGEERTNKEFKKK